MSSSPSPSIGLYERLAEGVRVWIDARGWTDFSEIQANAMPQLLDGHGGLLIAPTASGKTEAAVLPLLSRVIEGRDQPIALLYVAPLRALINDQARRVAKIVEECSLRTAWWHGDLPQNERRKILQRPPHALLTTPESLEVLLSSDGYGHGALLGNVRYVLVDEIHAFAASDRGAQLMSLLTRLEAGKRVPLTRVALSATVGAPESIVTWMSSRRADAAKVSVISESGMKGRRLGVGVVPEIRDAKLKKAEREQRSRERVADVLAKHAAGARLAIFARSRKEVESLTVELRERGIDALIHHGSLDVAIRRATEERFQQPGPKAIVATSTLELGIDIGDLELVIQVGAPSTVTSLLQRIGRSGRRFGTPSVGILYATQEDELPTVLAAGELALENVVEPLYPETGAIHVAFHQAINLVREQDTVPRDKLMLLLGSSGSFADISREEWDDLLDEMVEDELLDDDRGRLRIGPQAERRIGFANYRDFYSVFSTDDEWTVRNGEETIGTLDLRFPISDGRDVYFVLAGRRWKVDAVDRIRLLLRVSPATSGPIPTWTSGGAESSYEIMQRTCEILAGKTGPLETQALTEKLRGLRADAYALGISPGRIVLDGDQHGYIHGYTYLGTETNEYLATLLRCAMGVPVSADGEQIVVSRIVAQTTREVGELLQEIIANAERRADLERRVLDAENLPPVGKYWHLFGPKTRRHAVRRLFFGNRRNGDRLNDRKVHIPR